ncbi:hypothetical protein [Cupriavidus consociatus]|uniref:hypothetical protein n=1 Tax=Cupriavidus consociatus TaxID=2821357 RepID=UPI001AE484B4|nr:MULTISPECIES: hypothetical protein [unclassified Cupriavidus]MBP0620845.1 hypothetical protein [Cupriavidus sp. LEh25]MDK2657507.1 hypothetical protein [Cupriavidus sp. LEh21]
MHWTESINAGRELAEGLFPKELPVFQESRTTILFRVVVNGRGTYYGFFPHACDAIADALDHGAFSVAVVRA